MRFVADDACWHLPTSVGRRGFDQDVCGEAVEALFLGSSERYRADRTWDVHHVVAEDDLVTLHCTMHARTNAGKEYHGSYHMLFRIEHDRIAEAWEFLDTAYVFECLQPDEH
jgi:ketosteroid isomerase-like protein